MSSNDRTSKDPISAAHLEQVDSSTDEKMNGDNMILAAKDRAEKDHHLAPWEAIKAYPMAIFWSIMVSMCVIMEGYDTILIGNFYAYPTFAQKYGTYFPLLNEGVGGYQLTAAWQAGLGNASGIGAFFGVLLNGYLVGLFGMKRVLLGSLVVSLRLHLHDLLRSEYHCSHCWRATLWSALGQWVWPAFLFPILLFAPESPWHLVRHGRLDEAKHSLDRLVRKSANIDTKETLATIVHTNELEKTLSVGTSYWDCFKGTERRRTEIACVVFAGQVLSGSTFAYNSTYFFEQVGLKTATTYKLNLGGTGLALFGTLLSWFLLMPYFGRRTIYLWGMAVMTTILFIIGFLNVKTCENSIGMAQAVLTLGWTFVFQLSAGQLGWALPAEMGSTRLRQKTICLARNAYYIISVISNVLEPYFMNPTEWDLKGYTGFFWGSTALAVFVWGFFRLPETKGRTYDEMDILFAKEVPARKFKAYEVDAFDEQETARVARRYSTPK